VDLVDLFDPMAVLAGIILKYCDLELNKDIAKAECEDTK